jgi:hypothetical protein
MKIIEHLGLLESLITEYEERAGRGKNISAEVRDCVKRQARETLRRVLIDSDTKTRLYAQSNYMALSDRVWHLLESYFYACYANIDFPKPASRGPFIDIDHLRRTGELRWLEEPEGGLEGPAFQHPPFTLQDIELAAANLGFKLAIGKDMFPALSDCVAEMLLGKLCTGGCAERLAEGGHDNRVQRMEVE